MEPTQSTEATARSLVRTAWRFREPVIWIGLIAVVLTVQWPMLKGWVYRATGAQAPASGIVWRTDVDAALAEARATNKRVVIDFTASWCPPCITMKHDVWPNSEVVRLVEAGFVPVLIDTDRDTVFSARYGVDSIPTVLLLDPDGRVVKREGHLPRSGMLRFLTEPAE